MKEREKGFTLLELIIVMFLISLIASVSTVFFVNALPSEKVDATAREIATTLKQARALAQITGKGQAVVIDLDAKRYGIAGRRERTIPRNTGIEIVDPFSGDVRQGKYRLKFNADGSFEGGTVVVSARNKSVSISIDPIVGSVVLKKR